MHQHQVAAPAPTHPPRRRIHGLAGVAALVVVASSLGLPLSGGHLAVDALLVAIGFDLARTVRGHSHVADRAGIHRWGVIGRFVPVAVMAVALSALRTAVFHPDVSLSAVRIAMSTLMVTNLTPAFELVGLIDRPTTVGSLSPSTPLDHLWLVSVVFQFSLLAPALVLAGRRRLRPETRAAVVAALAAAVFALRCAAVSVRADASTPLELLRVDALLLGLAVGMVPLGLLRRPSLVRATAPALGIITLVVVLGPPPASPSVPGGSAALAVGLSGVVAVAAALMAGASTAALDPGVFNSLPLRWLGERAVGLHLWHVLFGLMLGPGPFDGSVRLAAGGRTPNVDVVGGDAGWPGFPLFMVRLVFCLAAAAISHRLIEQPCRIALRRHRLRWSERAGRTGSKRRHPAAPTAQAEGGPAEWNRQTVVGRPAPKTL